MFKAGDATVVIVEDDVGVRESLEALMASANYRCQSYGSAEDFLQNAPPANPCCLLADLHLPGIDALALQAALSDRGQRIPMLFLSGDADAAQVARAMKAGALNFFHKPVNIDRLLTCTERGLEMSTH